jgi:hypothetical protein
LPTQCEQQDGNAPQNVVSCWRHPAHYEPSREPSDKDDDRNDHYGGAHCSGPCPARTCGQRYANRARDNGSGRRVIGALLWSAGIVLPLAAFMGLVWIGIVGRAPHEIAANLEGSRAAGYQRASEAAGARGDFVSPGCPKRKITA